jgi:quinohemoprotein ethanol dehydrogenase
MRRLVVLVAAAGLAAFFVVALASASNVTHHAKTTAKVANPDLPTGVAACGDSWLAPGCNESSTAYSTLTQINPSNVGKLHMLWQQSFNGPAFTGRVEAQPICCANDMMYETISTGTVGVDPLTGATKWHYQGAASNTARTDSVTPVLTSGARDESFDAKANLLFSGQQDGSVVALNAKTGAPVWTSQVSGVGTYGSATHSETSPFTTYYDNGADGMLLTAPNGGESPIRGHLDAYDATNGKLIWRSWTTPDPNQLPFILTWSNPAEAAVAGATVWSLPATDPQLKRVTFGTGNPYPYTGRQAGKDLWSDTLMSLDINSGAMKWYYQAVHHDLWDYDCPTPTVRFNAPVGGKMMPIVAGSCKSGYIYLLNANNGHPIYPVPEVPVPNLNGGKGQALNFTWPTQPEPTGGESQILIHCPTAAQAQAAIAGYPTAPNGTNIVLTCPYPGTYNDEYLLWGPFWGNGGTDYPRMSYDPLTNDLYVCANVTLLAMENRSPTDYHLLSITSGTYAAGGWAGSVSALNVGTNKLDWQAQWQANAEGPCYSGMLSTASGVVFTGGHGRTDASSATLTSQGIPYGGYLLAYDAKTGKELFRWQASDIIQAPPITYMYKGKQYVAIYAAGPVASGQHDRLTVFSE